MREVVLDANVIVAWLDDADVLASRARELMNRLRAEGAEVVLIDVTASVKSGPSALDGVHDFTTAQD